MALSENDVSDIKEKLLNQLSNLPEDSREIVRQKIESMDAKQLDKFLSENAVMDGCIFCSIVEGKTPTYIVYEDEIFLGVLNIRPIAKGHVFLIPKDHNFSSREFKYHDNLKSKLFKALKDSFPESKSIVIKEQEFFNHPVISFLPVSEGGVSEKEISIEKEEFLDIQERVKASLERLEKNEDFIKEKNEELVKDLFKCDSRIP